MTPPPSSIAAALILFTMMLVVGLELTPSDFRRVAAHPRAAIAGTLGQLILLPLATAGLLLAWDLEPHIAAGLVLITATPGGGISNVFAFLAGAHTALSVTLTAVSSLLAVVTLPVVLAAGVRIVVGDEVALEVPVVPMIGQLVVLVLLPIGIGMRVRAVRPVLRERYAKALQRGTLVAIVVLLALSLAGDQTGLAGDVVLGVALAIVWTSMAMGLGYGLGWAVGLEPVDAFTLLIEFSVKNVGLAAIVALAALERPDLAVFSGAYVLTGYPLAAGAALLFRRSRFSL